MALLERCKELDLGNYMTITQCAAYKNVDYHAMRKWLYNHPNIDIVRVNRSILVRKDELEKYQPR